MTYNSEIWVGVTSQPFKSPLFLFESVHFLQISGSSAPGSALQSPSSEENGNKVLTQGDKLNLIKARKHTQSLRPVAVENLKSGSTTHSRVKSVPAAIKVCGTFQIWV